jgi:hypothetical protein
MGSPLNLYAIDPSVTFLKIAPAHVARLLSLFFTVTTAGAVSCYVKSAALRFIRMRIAFQKF